MRKKFCSEVSFVGSLYTEHCPYDKLSNPSAELTGYLNGIMDAQSLVYGYYFIEELLTTDICETFKKHLPSYCTYPMDNFLTDQKIIGQHYIGSKITALERIRTMQILSEHFNMDLYTSSDTSMLPKIHNRGLANSLTEMPVIFHESKINLNTTSKSIRTGLPLRIFDIMCCGGFVLTNFQTELPFLFNLDEEIVSYGSLEELCDKTAYYLEHEQERLEIAHNGFERVSREYTFPIRLTEMLLQAFSVSI